MDNEFAAGASAARYKLAAYLREHGVDVRPSRWGCPPSDDDFLQAVLRAIDEGRGGKPRPFGRAA